MAIFAGAIGAIALCTRKNYLFTTTGIAIATAVIPPLSVVGYGIGSLKIAMATGGFLLFFTNLVAIVISSDAVFMLLRFRSSMVEESAYPLGLRVKILGVTLALLSIPLVATLVTDVRTLKLSRQIEETLKNNLNVEGNCRLTEFSIDREDQGIKVLASVHTVAGIDTVTENRLRKELSGKAGRTVALEIEQIIVQAGTIKQPETNLAKIVLAATAPPPKDTLPLLRGKTMGIVKEACNEAGVFLAPWPIRECRVSFSDGTAPLTLLVTVGRDFPISAQEQRWLSLAVEKKLAHPVKLETQVTPLLPPLTIGADGVPDEAGRKALSILKQIAASPTPLQATLAYPAGSRRTRTILRNQAESLKRYLVKETGLAAGSITLRAGGPAYRVTVQ